jgi:hypothetical protein
MLPTPDNHHLGSREVRRRYNDISDMALWRWLHNEKLNFPRPTIINRRRYWLLTDLERWERARFRRSRVMRGDPHPLTKTGAERQ